MLQFVPSSDQIMITGCSQPSLEIEALDLPEFEEHLQVIVSARDGMDSPHHLPRCSMHGIFTYKAGSLMGILCRWIYTIHWASGFTKTTPWRLIQEEETMETIRSIRFSLVLHPLHVGFEMLGYTCLHDFFQGDRSGRWLQKDMDGRSSRTLCSWPILDT